MNAPLPSLFGDTANRPDVSMFADARSVLLVLESLSTHIAILNAKGEIIYANAPWLQFAANNQCCGLHLGVGASYLDTTRLHSPRINAAVRVAMQKTKKAVQALLANKIEKIQFDYSCHSETEQRWFEITVTRYLGDGPPKLVVAQENITARKSFEITLLSKGQKLRSIYDSSSDAIMLLDEHGFFDCNQKTLQLFGFSSTSELVDLSPSDLSPRYQPDGGLSSVDAAAHMRRAFDCGESRFEWLHVKRDGTQFPTEVLLSAFEYDNRQVLQATVRDISERKAVELKLQAMNKQLQEDLQARIAVEKSLRETTTYLDVYRRIVDHHAIVAETDVKGTIVAVNDQFCRISGYTREELIGKNHRLLNSGTHPKSMWTEMYRTVANKGVWHGEICNRTKQGQLYWVDTTIAPLFDEQERVRGYFSIRADITSLKAAQVESDAASRSKSEFLANMSHEIRTPMTAIIGYAELLADDHGDSPEAGQRLEYANTIKRNGEHLLSIINDILDLSKIEAEKMTIEQIDASPIQIAKDVIDLMRVKSQAKGLLLNLTFQTGIPETIKTDPTRLRQILVNLVGNAIKFTEVGTVTVRMRMDLSHGSHLCFDVKDTGIGLREQQVAKLFEAFEQVDTSMTRKYGGTGLGLRISKRLAEKLGGDICVFCESGEGCVFSVSVATGDLTGVSVVSPEDIPGTLLTNKDNEPACKESTLLESQGGALAGRKILLVEDGPDNQRLITFLLRKAGAEVILRENGKLAVEFLSIDGALEGPLCDSNSIDLVLMDMQMPEMDGYKATELLRKKGCTTPILALTAHAMASDLEKCLNAGCNTRLTKPIDRTALINACSIWIQSRKAI
jgi:PAS domain S-box-containing protein